MDRERKRANNANSLELRLLKYLHLVVSVLVFFWFWLRFRYPTGEWQVTRAFRYDVFVSLGFGALLAWFFKTYNAYTLGYFRIRALAFSQFLGQFFSAVIIYFVVSIGWWQFHNPLAFLPMLILMAIWDCAWSYWANSFYYRLVKTYRTAVIYRNEKDLIRFGDTSGKPIERMFRVEKYICYDGNDYLYILDQIGNCDAIFVAGVNPWLMNGLCKYCVEANVRGFFLPHIGDTIMFGAEHIKSFTTPVLSVRRTQIPFEYALIKRAFDFSAALLGLILLSPLMLMTAILIKAYDGGPVFYKQVRLTKDGKKFKISKFRSMRIDA